jgi:predicted amidohydrolase
VHTPAAAGPARETGRQALTRHDDPALLLGVAQTAPRLRDVPANVRRIGDLARSTAADLLLTPELSLTGYDVGDSVHRLAVDAVPGQVPGVELPDLPGEVVFGLVEATAGGPRNAAVAVREGRVTFVHRKIHLPTYGMFDEGRWFGRGSRLDVWQPLPGWTCGLLICEDFWHPGLAYVLASRGIDVLLVQAAAPGRGVWQGGPHGAFASAAAWERIAQTTAQLYGVFVALCNRVGVEGGVTFAGGSIIVAPDGTVLTRADDESEQVITAELTHGALRRARQPYSHARDDDPRLVLRELRRALPA